MKKILLCLLLACICLHADKLRNNAFFRFNEIDESYSISLAPRHDIEFELEENATTGYQWVAEFDSRYVDVDIDHKGPKQTFFRTGQPGRAEIEIEPNVPGVHIVRLHYRRTFEKDVPSLFMVTIVIHAGHGPEYNFGPERYPKPIPGSQNGPFRHNPPPPPPQPQPPKPVKPVPPQPVKPVPPQPVKPVPPQPVKPVPPQPVKPVPPQPPKPVKPVPPQPPKPVKPVPPQPPKPVKPVQPQPPKPVKPVQPQPPKPVKPVQPQPPQPVKPVQPQPPQPVKPVQPLPPMNQPGQPMHR